MRRRCATRSTNISQAMLEHPLATVSLNGPLVAQARAVLTREPFAEYVYNRLLKSPVVTGLPEWTVADNAGPGGRTGVRTARRQIPEHRRSGLLHRVRATIPSSLGLLPGVTKNATEGDWVLGTPADRRRRGVAGGDGKLRADVIALYLDDYTRRWDALLANIALKPFTSLQQGTDELFVLSAPDSPLRDLLTAIDGQTQLSTPGGERTRRRPRPRRRPARSASSSAGSPPTWRARVCRWSRTRRSVSSARPSGAGGRQAGRSGDAGGRAFPATACVRRRQQGPAGAA